MEKDQQDIDFEWFVENYDDLFARYGNKFLAIKNKTVLGAYDSYISGINETSKSEPMGTFIVQQCNGDESGYTNYISSMNFMGAVG